jgi:hypothetical protein
MFNNLLNMLNRLAKVFNKPAVAGFYLYLVLLWLLNIADVIQTVLLSEGGHLRREANFFMDFFLTKDWRLFILGKLLPLLLVTAMVIRGYTDKKGASIGGHRYTPEEMRTIIISLIGAGVVYYLIIVLFPFITLIIALLCA